MRFTVALIAIATVAVTSLGSGGGTYEPAQSIRCSFAWNWCFDGAPASAVWWCTPPQDAPTPGCCPMVSNTTPGACLTGFAQGCCGGTVVPN